MLMISLSKNLKSRSAVLNLVNEDKLKIGEYIMLSEGRITAEKINCRASRANSFVTFLNIRCNAGSYLKSQDRSRSGSEFPE